MDTSRLPKIQDEERESQFGYVHGVSGPGGGLFTLFIYVFSVHFHLICHLVCHSQLKCLTSL